MIYIKSFFKKLPVWLSVVALLLCTALSFPVGASAASTNGNFIVESSLESPLYVSTSGEDVSLGDYTGTLYFCPFVNNSTEPVFLDAGSYVVSGIPYISDVSLPAAAQVILVHKDDESILLYDFGEVFTVHESGTYFLYAQSFSLPVLSEYVSSEPLYYSAFQMFANFIYGEGADLTAEQNMVMTILATSVALACVFLPFLIVFGIARRFGL